MDQQEHPDVGEQAEGQPFQRLGISAVGDEQLQGDAHQGEADHENMSAAAHDQLGAGGHCRKVCADIEGVRREQDADEQQDERAGKGPNEIPGETATGHAPDVRADELHRRHQRIGEDLRPQQTVAELRARLRIGGNSAGIVVSRAGDDSRPELLGGFDARVLEPLEDAGFDLHTAKLPESGGLG